MTDDTPLPDGVKIRRRKLTDYNQNAANHNKGTARGAEMLETSFKKHRAGRSLLAAADDGLIAGNQSQKAALAAGFEEVIEIETDGSVPVVVKRTDLTDVASPEATALAYADNITHTVSFDLDTAQVLRDVERGVDLTGLWTPAELAAMTQPVIQSGESGDAAPVGMEAAKLLQEKWRTAPGRWPDRFRNGFEPVHQFARPGKGKFYPERVGHWSDDVMVSTAIAGVQESIGTGDYYNTSGETKPGMALPDNVIAVQGTEAGVAHSAMFPVGLPEFFIKAYTDEGDIVYDPFLGGGTTLVAAHQQQRRGYGIEMMPEHVAVILERLAGHGMNPRLEA